MPDDHPELDLDAQLCFPLYAASRAVTALYYDLLADVGLTYPQYLVMLALWKSDAATVGQLGMRLRLDSGTLSPLLKRLAGAGLLERRRDACDERRVLITVTEQGRQLRERVAHVPGDLASLTGLDEATYHQLRSILATLIATIDARRNSPARAATA